MQIQPYGLKFSRSIRFDKNEMLAENKIDENVELKLIK
jgi:hypothetical protein